LSRDRLLLEHIRDAATRIAQYTSGGKSAFLADSLIQDGVMRNLEVIGEAVKGLSDASRNQQPQIPWKRIAGLRDFLIHVYFGVDLEKVWDVVEHRLPELKLAIETMLA
jgi:uncharacterized protein with HEPN domain